MLSHVVIDIACAELLVTSVRTLAQTDYESGHSRGWYVMVGLLMLAPLALLILLWLLSSRREARTQAILQALRMDRRVTVFEMAQRLGRKDPERLWAELEQLRSGGQLPSHRLDEPGRAIERDIPPDPWRCASCGAENDGRNGLLRCDSCDTPRPPPL